MLLTRILSFDQKLIVKMGGWLNFLKIYPYQPQAKVMVRSNVWCLLIKSSNFTFDEDAASLPEIAFLDESVTGFPEYIGISAPNLRYG